MLLIASFLIMGVSFAQFCPTYIDEVCWSDWVTYSNSCFAGLEWVEVEYKWACVPDYSVFWWQERVPQSCAKWYNWCWICEIDVEWRKAISCDSYVCENKEKGFCLEYYYVFLREEHKEFIAELFEEKKAVIEESDPKILRMKLDIMIEEREAKLDEMKWKKKSERRDALLAAEILRYMKYLIANL